MTLRARSLGCRRYCAYTRATCCSSVTCAGGMSPVRPSSCRSARLNAVPRFSLGSDRIWRPRSLVCHLPSSSSHSVRIVQYGLVTIKHATASALIFSKLDSEWWLGLILHPLFGKLMIPGGHIEEGETAPEAALREVAEETGLAVRFLPALAPAAPE